VTDSREVQLAHLQRIVAAQGREIAALRAELRRLETSRVAMDAVVRPDVADPANADDAPPTMNRRAFARLGALAGAGAAVTAAAILTGGAPSAAAAEGEPVLLGKDNVGASARTGIFNASLDLYATLADPSLSVGFAPVTTGVFGKGSYGVVGAGLGLQGAGVYGTDNAINGSQRGDAGLCVGVLGYIDSPTNPSPAVSAVTNGTGPALQAVIDSGESTAPVVLVVNQGAGANIEIVDSNQVVDGGEIQDQIADATPRLLGRGPGVVVRLQNPDNQSPALVASTTGSGPGLEVVANSTAISAKSTNGVAAELSSQVAHLRLVPGTGSHPASGQTGDIFVDSAGDLWYCRHGTIWTSLT
jgi:hypothetical protein